MNLLIVMGVIFTHWVADFVLQTHWQSINKSKNNKALLTHTLNYSAVWLGVSLVFGLITMPWVSAVWFAIWFALVTFVAHTITDYFTSRLNAKLWANGDAHNFFVSVGFDQVLHYAQLYITFYMLTR